MLKKNKGKIVISSLIILLPALFGIIMWNDLPNTMTTHWGADGNADGFGSKAFAVFGLPAIFLVIHFVCLLFTLFDQKQKEQSPKALGIIFWVAPVICVFVSAIIYGTALGKTLDFAPFVPVLLGAMFLFMGNYLPKVKQNSTLGIKLSWTLYNEENWNKTHRFGGKVWVVGGIVLLLSGFLPLPAMVWVMLCVIAAAVTLPIVYSYCIYKQHKKEGIVYAAAPKSKAQRIAAGTTAVIVSVILIGTAVLMFTGNIQVQCEEHDLQIHAAYWTDLEVRYSDIDEIIYRKDLDIGFRTNGFGSARLSMGVFQNEEFGSYTLYAYTGAKEFIVLTSNGETLVIAMRDTKDTQAIYHALLEKTGL